MNSVSRIVSVLFLTIATVFAQVPKQPSTDHPRNRDITVIPLRPEQHPPNGQLIPRGYALVVGIGKYENLDPLEYLRFAETDAGAIRRSLISKEEGAFPDENVHMLLGSQATLANLQYELEHWLPSVANQPNDRVVVYFAGHGFVKNGRGYLAPWDVDASNPEKTAYSMDQLGKALAGKVKAQFKLLLVDACHSGKITPETTDNAIDAQLNQLPKQFLTFTAARAAERSYEDPKLSTGFGLFTYFLVQGLQGNADNDPCDGVITADELVEYVRGEVRSYARARGVFQTPSDHGDVDYDKMILGIHSACTGTAPSASLSLGTIVVESNMDGVQVYLDDQFVGRVGKDTPLVLPGQSAGIHLVKGVHEGYEPDTKQELIVPGQQHTVTLRIQYRREYKRSAVESVESGEKLLFRPSLASKTVNPVEIYTPSRQTDRQLLRAREFFMDALKEEPNYARAAYDLAQACNLLSDNKGMLGAYRQAIQSDPTYLEARVDYAGALIEEGDPDEAIRQLLEAIRLNARNDLAYSHLSRAYLDKGVWQRAIEAADQAITLNSKNHQAYLWKADALRRAGASEKDKALRQQTYTQAVDHYEIYLRLTNFSTPLYGQLAYWGGLGLGGSRHRPDRPVTYAYQRSMAFMGFCECQDMMGNPRRAIQYCERAIHYDSKDPIGYFLLGNAYSDLFNQVASRESLVSARNNYVKMLTINPHLEQGPHVKGYIEQIDMLLAKLNK